MEEMHSLAISLKSSFFQKEIRKVVTPRINKVFLWFLYKGITSNFLF